MKLNFKFGLLFSGIYIIIELTMLLIGVKHSQETIIYTMGANTLLLLLAVALSILINFNRKKAGGLSMIADLKMGIGAGAVYAIVTASFLWLYFGVLDPSYPELRKQQIEMRMNSKEDYAILVEQVEGSDVINQNMSAEDLQEQNLDNVSQMLGANTIFPMALFSLLLLGMIYAFFVTAFNRLILAKL